MSVSLWPFSNNTLKNQGYLSLRLIKMGIDNFYSVLEFVWKLDYRRLSDPSNLSLTLIEKCGTCSTKHAFIYKVIEEQGIKDFELFVGIFMMNSKRFEKIAPILKKYNLKYIPEAHCYLKYQGKIIDITWYNKEKNITFDEEILNEIKTTFKAVVKDKKEFHKQYLEQWLLKNPNDLVRSPEKLWDIREECILALS